MGRGGGGSGRGVGGGHVFYHSKHGGWMCIRIVKGLGVKLTGHTAGKDLTDFAADVAADYTFSNPLGPAGMGLCKYVDTYVSMYLCRYVCVY